MSILPSSDYHSPYFINLPAPTAQPTEQLVKRFSVWRKLLKQLIYYFKELSIVKDYSSRINQQMLKSIQFPALTDPTGSPTTSRPGLVKNKSHTSLHKVKSPSGVISPASPALKKPGDHHDDLNVPAGFFLAEGNGSIMDISSSLSQIHRILALRENQTSKELNNVLIPRLEIMRKDLSSKIKEIKSLNGHFKHNMAKHVSITGKILHSFVQSIENFYTDEPMKNYKINQQKDILDINFSLFDPYLLRLQLDSQLKEQLIEENHIKIAFINLQKKSLELEQIIYREFQNSLNRLIHLIGSEYDCQDLFSIKLLQQTILSKDPSCEWNYFISKNDNFIKDYKIRSLHDIIYPYKDSILTKNIRSGVLLKKNKVLKNYASNYYVLTSNFLHEFDRPKDLEPVCSYYLDDYLFIKESGAKPKFTLVGKKNNKSKVSFKCGDSKEFPRWCGDLENLLSFDTHLERFDSIERKVQEQKDRENDISSLKPTKINLSSPEDGSYLTAIHSPRIATPRVELDHQTDYGLINDLNNSELLAKLNDLQRQQQSNLSNFDSSITKSHTLNYSGRNSPDSFDDMIKGLSNTGLVSPPLERNPFERTLSDPHTQQQQSMFSSNSSLNSPNLTTTSSTGVNTPQNSQHQNYLKAQKEYLRKQQQLIEMKLNQMDDSLYSSSTSPSAYSRAHSPPAVSSTIPSAYTHHRTLSSQSIQSVTPVSNIANQANNILNMKFNNSTSSLNSQVMPASNIKSMLKSANTMNYNDIVYGDKREEIKKEESKEQTPTFSISSGDS